MSTSNPFWRETKRLGDGNAGISPRLSEGASLGYKVGPSPRGPLSPTKSFNGQNTDSTENTELNEPRFGQWSSQNCFVLSCLKRFNDVETVLSKVFSWFIDSLIKAFMKGGYIKTLQFLGSREGIICVELLSSLTTRDCCVDGCPDIAFLLSRLVKIFLDMPTHDVSKTLSPFTNHASRSLRLEAAQRNTIFCRPDASSSSSEDGPFSVDDDSASEADEFFFPSAALIDAFNKGSSKLAQAELYADRPEGTMPWKKLPKVFSDIIESTKRRLDAQSLGPGDGGADISTGSGGSPILVSTTSPTVSAAASSSLSTSPLLISQPPPILLQRRASRAPLPQMYYHHHHNQQQQQVPTSLFGSICTHLLNVLEKLFFGPSTLKGFLSRERAVDPLVQVLKMDYAKGGSELYVVHRQLVRTFASLMVGSSRTADGIALLSGHRVIESFVDVLRGDTLPIGVRMEIIQLMAHILCMSSRLSDNLVVAFKECGGYDALLNFFLSKECNEGPLEKSRLVKLLCYFLFVMPTPQHSGTASGSSFDKCVVVENFDGVKLVLDVFVRTTDEELRTELLIAIQSIFTLQAKSNARTKSNKWIRRQEANPFIALLVKFDELSMANKKQILPIFDDVIVTSGLSPEELKCYCAKLKQDMSPSTIILFQMHITRLLENKHLLRSQLELAGILDILASYFVQPCELKCASMLDDPRELAMALDLIGSDDDDYDDYDSIDIDNYDEDEDGGDEAVSEKEASIRRVLHWISTCSLTLLTSIIKNNEDIQRKLKDRDDFRALFRLLYTPDLRNEALKIITIIATKFPAPKDMVVQHIISAINFTLDANPRNIRSSRNTIITQDKLLTWKSIFDTLNTILEARKEASLSFKEGGGFFSVLSILNCFRGQNIEHRELASKFIVSTVRVLRAALKGSLESTPFYKDKASSRSQLTTILKICFEHCLPADLDELIDIVISIGVLGSWPPPAPGTCPRKKCGTEEDEESGGGVTGDGSGGMLCSECALSMTVEVPEVIQILLLDLQDIIAAKDPGAQQRVLEKIRALVTFSPDNLEALNHAGVHNSILASPLGEKIIQRTIDGPSGNDGEDRNTELLLDILMSILAQNLSGRNVKYLLKELKRTGYSPGVTALLQRLADKPQSPSSYMLLSGKSGVVGVKSKTLRSRPWPPRQFTASMWICVKSYGKSGRLELFSFQTQSRGVQLCAFLNSQGALTFQAASSGISEVDSAQDGSLQGHITFTKGRITENAWHHIVIGYSTSTQQQGQQGQQQGQQIQQQPLPQQSSQDAGKQQGGDKGKITDPHTCAVDLYVDGDFVEQAYISLPLGEVTQMELVVGSLPKKQEIGGGCDTGSLKVSSMYFFGAAPRTMDVLLMYSFKSGYWGNMMTDFSTLKHCLTVTGPPSEDVTNLLLRPGSISLEALTRNLVAAFIPRKMLVVDSEILSAGSSVMLLTTAKHGSGKGSGSAGDSSTQHHKLLVPVARNSWNIREVLNEVGGIQIVLYMIGTAATRAQQHGAFRLLVSLLRDSPANYQQMCACKGYKLLSRIMGKPSWELDREMLDLAFALVGVSRTRGSDAYDSGVILDVDALQCLIFDWHIWERAPDALKEDLFQGLSSLITVNNASAFNLARLTRCNIVTELMHIIQRADTSMRIIRAVVSLIKEVIDASSVRKNDVQAIANFLFATHKVEKPVNSKATVAAASDDSANVKKQNSNARHIHFPLLTTSVIGGTLSPQRSRSKSISVARSALRNQTTKKKIDVDENEDNEDNDERRSNKEEGEEEENEMSERKKCENDLLIQKRVVVLEMLHDILSRVNYAAKESFVEAFPLEVTLAMLQHSTLALRVPLLILLGLCLQNDPQTGMGKYQRKGGKGFLRMSHDPTALSISSPAGSSTVGARSLYSRFVGLGGFDLLGVQLQSYSASAELYHTLFRLLVGSHFPKEFKAAANISGNGLSMAVAEAEAAMLSAAGSSGDSGSSSGGGAGGGAGGVGSAGSGQGAFAGGAAQRDEGEKFTLARPEVLKTIIRVASSSHAKYQEQHSVIRGLHQICTISESSMQELLQNGLAKGLFSILHARIRERSNRGLVATGNSRGRMRNGSIGTAPEKGVLGIFRPQRGRPLENALVSAVSLAVPPNIADEVPDESDDFLRRVKDDDDDSNDESKEEGEEEGEDDSTENDEDIILFVKTIILNTTREESIGKNLAEILLSLRTAGLPVDVMGVLQERILHDVFKVFAENPGFYNSPYLVSKFTLLAEVAIEFIRWDIAPITPKSDASSEHGNEAKESNNSGSSSDGTSSNASNNSTAFPSRGYLRITNTRQDKAVLMVLVLLINILSKGATVHEKVAKIVPKIAELAWRVLLYALRDSTHTSELCAIALSAAREGYLLGTCPQVGRTYAIMFHATRFYASPLLEDAARNAVAEMLRLGPRPNTLFLSLTPGHYRLDSEAARNVSAAVQDAFQLPSECAEAKMMHTTYVEETIGWVNQEARRASEFRAAQLENAREGWRHQDALRASVAEKRRFIAEAAQRVQKRAEDRPQLEVSRQRRADAALTHAAWKAIFNGVTHRRAVFAMVIHTPFRRLGLDSTVDERWQRLRLHWEVSDPQEVTLNPPFYTVSVEDESKRYAPWALFVKDVKDHEFFRMEGYGNEFGRSGTLNKDADPNPSLPTDMFPTVNCVEPQYENGTAGGGTVHIYGSKIALGDPKLEVFIGGVACDIVGGTSGSEVVVKSPPQRDPGFYSVVVAYDGYFRKSVNRYGYLEVEMLKQYLAAKSAIPLDPDMPAVPVQLTCGIPKQAQNVYSPRSAISSNSSASTTAKKGASDTPSSPNEGGEREGNPIVFKEKYAEVLDCKWITAFSERPGKVCTNREGLAFFAEGSVVGVSRKYTWRFEDISEIYGRRHLLCDVAIELFFTTGKTCLFAFADKATRDRFWAIIRKANLPNLLVCDTEDDLRGGLLTNSLTDRWAFGQISNYEYLMRLNVLAGRTFNDLNQYPVFPWILADYTSKTLDLNDPKTFRDLSKPMGALDPERAQKFIAKYEQLAEMGDEPYFYGTHYSSSGAVLHFMSRLEPYARYHVAFQSGRFDVPDRLFFDVGVAWRLSSSAALGDVKELIPEFFTLPEMFENRNNFDFGSRQDGSRVHDVRLPPWAKGDPREFVRIHRAALECEYVSAHLHEWIDLIFGYKQQSKEDLNVFHPYTCEGGIDWDAIEDPVDRLAKQTQVNTWGQTPRKLFTKPHPKRNIRALQQIAASVPVYTTPFMARFIKRIGSAVGEISIVNGTPSFYGSKMIPLSTGNRFRKPFGNGSSSNGGNGGNGNGGGDGSGAKSGGGASGGGNGNGGGSNDGTGMSSAGSSCGNISGSENGNSSSSISIIEEGEAVTAPEIVSTTSSRDNVAADMFSESGSGRKGANFDEYITWGHWDNSVRLVLGDSKGMVINTGDTITSAASSSSGHCVVCGSSGGVVIAWKRRDPQTPALLGRAVRLYGHTAPVTAVFVSSEYNIIVSGSKDATCIVWDISKMTYVRTLQHNHPIVAICVSPVTGYIYTIERPVDSGAATINMWSVNGDQITYANIPGANCVQVTANTPGVKNNYVAVGNLNGSISLLSGNYLKDVSVLTRDPSSVPLSPITSIAFS